MLVKDERPQPPTTNHWCSHHATAIAEARQRAAHPDIQKKKHKNFDGKPENRQNRFDHRRSKQRPIPSAKKHQGCQARHRDHVGVLGHEEHGKFHGAVFGVVAGHQLGLSLWKVEGNAVGLGISRHDVAEEADNLSAENVPTGDESPEMAVLRVDDVFETEASRHDEDADQRQAERNLVAHHLRAGAQAAEQGILVVGGPSGEGDAVDSDRSYTQNQQ